MNYYSDSVFLLSIVHNLFFLIIFLLAVFFAFYVPGSVILGNKLGAISKSIFAQIILSISLGLVLWGYQGVIFGYLGLRFLSYIYILIFFLMWLRKFKKRQFNFLIFKKTVSKLFRKNFLLIAIMTVGIFGQNQQFIVTAFNFSDGIRGFTWSLDDTFWHSGLISSLLRTFPPIEPGMHGVVVQNYHYWSNVVIAELIRVFHLPLLSTQYFYMGMFLSFLLGSLAYIFGSQVGLKKAGLTIIVFLQYFSSDIIYLLTFITRQVFIFKIHPLEDGTMLLENTPRAFSFVVLFLGVILVNHWLKRRDKRIGILLILIFGSIIGYKVHTGAMALFSVGILCLYLFLKRQFSDTYIGLSIVLAFLIYYPVNAGAGGALYVPFEMTSRNFAVQNGLNLSRLELARRIYSDHSNLLQSLRMDFIMVFIYVISQFGVKTIGLLPLRKTIKLLTFPLWMMIYGGLLFTFVFGLLFIQPIAPADIFNSFLSGSFFLSILAAVTLNNWFVNKKKVFQIALIIALVAMTIPRWVYKTSTFANYFKTTTPVISIAELSALNFLKQIPNREIVLVLNNGQWDSHYSYVSIFSETNTFLSGQVIMSRHGIDFSERVKVLQTIQNSSDVKLIRQLLDKNSISYLYLYGEYNLKVDKKLLDLEEIFNNGTISILKVNR